MLWRRILLQQREHVTGQYRCQNYKKSCLYKTNIIENWTRNLKSRTGQVYSDIDVLSNGFVARGLCNIDFSALFREGSPALRIFLHRSTYISVKR